MEIQKLRKEDFEKPVQVAYITGVSWAPQPYRGITLHLLTVLHDGMQYRHDEVLCTGEKCRPKMDAWKNVLWIPPEVTDTILIEDPKFYLMLDYIRWDIRGKFVHTYRGDYFSPSSASAVQVSPDYGLEYFARRWMWWKAKHGKHRGDPARTPAPVNGYAQELIRDIRGKVDELETLVNLYVPAPRAPVRAAPRRAVGKPVEAETPVEMLGVHDFIGDEPVDGAAEMELVGDYV